MKKKNVLMMAVSAVLVAAVSIGGTLAYLTATDDAVVNTFQFANNISVTLSEEEPTAVANETITANQKNGFDYKNVVPGQKLNKAPKITVTTTVPTYVFARVTPNALVTIDSYTEGWTELVGVNPTTKNVYYKLVNGSDSAQDLGTLFTQVTVANSALEIGKETVELGDITIEVAAIQQGNFTTPTLAYGSAEFKALT